MATGLDLKEQLFFRVTFASLQYGGGPFGNRFRGGSQNEPAAEEGQPVLFLELQVDPLGPSRAQHQLRGILGKHPATARIHRDTTAQYETGTGILARGFLSICKIEEERREYVDIFGLLPENSFDAIAHALIAGGRELLARCWLQIGLQEERENVDLEKREGPLNEVAYLLGDLAMGFEIGERHKE